MTVAGILAGTQLCVCGRPFAELMNEQERRAWLDINIVESADSLVRYWRCPFENETHSAEVHGQDDYYYERKKARRR
jgi:hypothetical protein